MKKYISAGLAAVAAVALTGCNDFLNDNRYPLDQQTNTPAYWDQATNCQMQCDYFYNNFAGYGNASSRNGSFYFASLSDDQCNVYPSSNVIFTQWNYLQTPSSNGCWDASYTEVRQANTIIEGVEASKGLSDAEKANFLGIARLMRAVQYYDLVLNLGDVPLVTTVIQPDDNAELYGPRTPRNTVMDFALEDLNYACNNITAQTGKQVWSKDLALSIKSMICLYEASYARYHAKDDARARKYYNEVVSAAGTLIGSGRYWNCSDYKSLYNSYLKGLQENPEIIFFKGYVMGTLGNSICKYTSTYVPIMGMTRDAFQNYLFLDGKPTASTSLNTSDAVQITPDWWYATIAGPLSTRDKRLSATIDDIIGWPGWWGIRSNSDWFYATTGYPICKFINPTMSYDNVIYDGRNDVCAPLFWLARVQMDYIEAVAELGTITDDDVERCMNPLFRRAGLPAQTVAGLQAINDPANNMGISSLLWEIRRCRRCEFMFDDNIRWRDLVRWHQLELLDTQKYPRTAQGANLSEFPVASGGLDAVWLTDDGYINVAPTGNPRIFTEREYLQPLGSTQLTLNKQLKQNPGWEN